MDWKDVGSWISQNAGKGAALVGSLLTGNVPGAIAAGVSMVSGATGEADPEKALEALQKDPATLVKLRELAVQNEASIRQHQEATLKLQLEDEQAEHAQTQQTIRSGDNSQDVVVRRTRPLQSWLSLIVAIVYALLARYKGGITSTDIYVLGLFLTLPWAYAGLRQVGKGVDAYAQMKAITAKTKP